MTHVSSTTSLELENSISFSLFSLSHNLKQPVHALISWLDVEERREIRSGCHARLSTHAEREEREHQFSADENRKKCRRHHDVNCCVWEARKWASSREIICWAVERKFRQKTSRASVTFQLHLHAFFFYLRMKEKKTSKMSHNYPKNTHPHTLFRYWASIQQEKYCRTQISTNYFGMWERIISFSPKNPDISFTIRLIRAAFSTLNCDENYFRKVHGCCWLNRFVFACIFRMIFIAKCVSRRNALHPLPTILIWNSAMKIRQIFHFRWGERVRIRIWPRFEFILHSAHHMKNKCTHKLSTAAHVLWYPIYFFLSTVRLLKCKLMSVAADFAFSPDWLFALRTEVDETHSTVCTSVKTSHERGNYFELNVYRSCRRRE